MKVRFRTYLLLALLASTTPRPILAEQPNILWITAEDMSPNLGCYGDAYATTPHIDGFARESVRYTHAFATAPVCSPYPPSARTVEAPRRSLDRRVS